MESTWKIDGLRAHIRAQGRASPNSLDALNSLASAVNIFRFHLFGARDALVPHVDHDKAETKRNLEFVFGCESESATERELAVIAGEAHLLALAHITRNTWDIFGFLVNGLLVNPPLELDACNFHKVIERLPNGPLRAQMQKVCDGYWFKYFSGFVNISKHRMLIENVRSMSFVDDRAGLKVGRFVYGSIGFVDHWLREILEGALEVNNMLPACGRCLNEVVMGGNF